MRKLFALALVVALAIPAFAQSIKWVDPSAKRLTIAAAGAVSMGKRSAIGVDSVYVTVASGDTCNFSWTIALYPYVDAEAVNTISVADSLTSTSANAAAMVGGEAIPRGYLHYQITVTGKTLGNAVAPVDQVRIGLTEIRGKN